MLEYIVDCRLHIGYIIIGLNSKYIEHLVIDYSLHRHAELLAIAHLHAVSSQRKRIRIIETILRMLYYCLHLKECRVSNQILPVWSVIVKNEWVGVWLLSTVNTTSRNMAHIYTPVPPPLPQDRVMTRSAFSLGTWYPLELQPALHSVLGRSVIFKYGYSYL